MESQMDTTFGEFLREAEAPGATEATWENSEYLDQLNSVTVLKNIKIWIDEREPRLDILKFLIERYGFTSPSYLGVPLSIAFRNGRLKVVNLLLTYPNEGYKDVLEEASKSNSLECIKVAADLDQRPNYSQALAYVFSKGNFSFAPWIIEKSPNNIEFVTLSFHEFRGCRTLEDFKVGMEMYSWPPEKLKGVQLAPYTDRHFNELLAFLAKRGRKEITKYMIENYTEKVQGSYSLISDAIEGQDTYVLHFILQHQFSKIMHEIPGLQNSYPVDWDEVENGKLWGALAPSACLFLLCRLENEGEVQNFDILKQKVSREDKELIKKAPIQPWAKKRIEKAIKEDETLYGTFHSGLDKKFKKYLS